jgi:hypothetical protein
VYTGQVGVLDWARAVWPDLSPGDRAWADACDGQQLASMAWIRREFPESRAPLNVWLRARDDQLCGGRMIEWLRANFEHGPI